MTEEESRIFEESVAEHQRQIDEHGYAERHGERFYEIETPYGKVWHITSLAKQKRVFRNMAILHMLESSGIKIDETFAAYIINIDPSRGEILDNWLKENNYTDDIDYIDKMTERAINYFSENLREMFAVNMLNYADEVFFYSLIKTVGEEKNTPPLTELAIFNHFAKFSTSRLKTRLGIRKTSGRKSKRTDEQLQKMLSFYDSVLTLIREAKKDYTLIKGKHRWMNSIKALHPQLPVSIIEKFAQKGITPSELALIWVGEKFDTRPTEYLRQEIIKVRKISVKNK